MLNNFKILEDNLFNFEPGYFYIFQCLVRNTDGNNSLYEEGYSNINKNILIKSWFVDSQEYYNRIKNEMKTLCELTGARLYVSLDRKSILKTFISVLSRVNELNVNLIHGQIPSVKKLQKLVVSAASVIDSSDKPNKRILFDMDVKNKDLLQALEKTIQRDYFVMPSKKGYHVVAKPFDTTKFYDELLFKLDQITAEEMKLPNSFLIKEVTFNKNELGLVYYPGNEEE